jgi:hypothetical protein
MEREFIASFREEINRDNEMLLENIAINNGKLERVDKLMEDIIIEKVILDSLYSVISDMAEANHFIAQKTTYNSIVNSGNMDLINEF